MEVARHISTSAMLAVVLLTSAASSPCADLRCLIQGSGLVWSRSGWGALELDISASQMAARGEMQLEASEAVPIEAALQWGPGGSEVLFRWTAGGDSYSALAVLSDSSRMLLHTSQGAIVELTLAGSEDAAASAAAASSGNENSTQSQSQALTASSTASGAALGVVGRMIKLSARTDGLCIVEQDGSVRLGGCDAAGAVWELVRGKTPAFRGLRSPTSGLCLQVPLPPAHPRALSGRHTTRLPGQNRARSPRIQ